MRIATANSRMAKRWKNQEMDWETFADKCSKTVRTGETVAEYRDMSKPDQDARKDVGGFVAGALREGKRKNGYVEARSMLTLDLDHAVPGIWDQITMLFDFKCLMYSTHKYTAKEPRVRLIIPLSREVSAEEFAPISRMIAKDIGIEMVDDTCHEAARLMYWPSTSDDGEFMFERQDGPLLNPDDVLARYKDWHDTSQWPMSSRQSEIVKKTLAKQADPMEKEGMVGAFCRTYDIHEAIETFLSDIYKPSALTGRYDYIPADSTAGVVIYDDKFAFSHHASDPASGKLMNAFDVVRIHMFGHLDEKAKADTSPNKLPSYKAMVDFAINDEKVKMQLAKEREMALDGAFDEDTSSWQTALELDKNGGIKETLTNFVEILRNDPRLREIAYNEHRCGIDIRKPDGLPWESLKPGWSDADMAALQAYIDRAYHIFSPGKMKAALLTVTSERSFHPIREYLESLPAWDGKKRLDTLFIDYLGAEDNPYTRAATRKPMVAAIKRVYKPGEKFDYIPVLAGPQGIGKSTLFNRLGGAYYSDALTIADMRDKTGPEKLMGYWILEISEMTGMKKVDVETVKSFASRQDDKFRVAYGTVVESHPRQCVIFGTTNTMTGFLRDVTGNRRFWPISVSGNTKVHPWELDDDTVKQIWAEALEAYKSGESLILSGEEASIALDQQQDAMESDDREGLVREYLDKLVPDDWADMDLGEKRLFLQGGGFAGQTKAGTVRRDRICNLEIWAECFGKDPAAIKKQDSYEISALMSKISEWTKYDGNKSGKLRFIGYGIQVAYVRKESLSDKEDFLS